MNNSDESIASMLTHIRSGKGLLILSNRHQRLLNSVLVAAVVVAVAITGCGPSCAVHTFPERHRQLVCLACSSDGRALVTGGEGGLKVWDVASMKLLRTIDWIGDVSVLACSPSGKFAVSDGGLDIAIWKLLAGRKLRSFSAKSGVLCLAYAREGRILVSAGISGDVQLWDTKDGTEIANLEHNDTIIYSLAVSPSGDLLATGDATGRVHIWNLKTMKELITADAPGGLVKALSFSPDGAMLASASRSSRDIDNNYYPGAITLWNVSTGGQAASWKWHGPGIISLGFSSPNCLVSSDLGGAVIFWDTRTQKRLLECEPRYGYPWVMAWCTSTRKLVIGSLGGVGIIKILTPPAAVLNPTEVTK